MYKLTEEGRIYAKKGLPERNLLDMVSKGSISMQEAKKLENFNIALQWAKKNNWILIDKGEIKLAESGKKAINLPSPLETALKALNLEGQALEASNLTGQAVSVPKAHKDIEKSKVSDDLIEIILKRNLAQKVDEKFAELEKMKGKEVVNLTPELMKTGLWKDVSFREYNVEWPGKKFYPGKRHPYRIFLKNLKDKLINLGFEEMDSRVILQDFWNCDCLFMPQTHSARDIHEIFYVDAKSPSVDKAVAGKVAREHEKYWGYKWDYEKSNRTLLMSQGTALSASHLPNLKIPGKYFSLAKVFRPDVVDATHLLEFYQLEGIVCDKSMNFRHLLGLLKQFAIDVAGAEAVKFYPDYFPFTEPSVQISAKHPKLGWVELGGAGIFRKEVTRPFGINEPIIAWGLGIDRLAMFHLGVTDIRELYSSNLKWLRENYYYAKD